MKRSDYNKRYTLEEVKNIFINHGYIPLFDNYKTNKDKLLCQSIKYHYKGYIRFNSLLCGQKIAWFHQANPYTIYNIKAFIVNNNISCELLSDEWISSYDDLSFECNLCNEKFKMSWNSFGKGKTKCCTDCANKYNASNKRNSLDFIKGEFTKYKLTPLFDGYVNNKQKLLARDNHGYIGLISYHQLSGGNKFDKFHPKNPYTYENIKNYIKLHNLDCEFISGKYKNNESVLTFKCSCGEHFFTSWSIFTNLNKTRCDKCSKVKSKLELLTEGWLIDNNVSFETQYSFDDCRNILPLPFDFYVKNNRDVILIECQGIQHYEPIEFFGGEEGLVYRKNNDDIKRKYCISKGIKLIEIYYKDFNNGRYKEILRKELIS